MLQTRDSFRQKWDSAWQSSAFRKKVIIGFCLIVIILSFFPLFFQSIEKRDGIVLHDWLLNQLPAYDVSLYVFIIIWVSGLLIFVRFVQEPDLLLQAIWAYALLCIVRIISISMVPLAPPEKLLPIIDPISNIFYGKKYITKDLFFSGHTATIFLIFLCLRKKADKVLSLIGTIIVGILLLIQHVHYTIDVIAAPFFTYGVYLAAKKMVVGIGQEPDHAKVDI